MDNGAAEKYKNASVPPPPPPPPTPPQLPVHTLRLACVVVLLLLLPLLPHPIETPSHLCGLGHDLVAAGVGPARHGGVPCWPVSCSHAGTGTRPTSANLWGGQNCIRGAWTPSSKGASPCDDDPQQTGPSGDRLHGPPERTRASSRGQPVIQTQGGARDGEVKTRGHP
eukprot:6693339-Pyramimonas_sp.AAC.1